MEKVFINTIGELKKVLEKYNDNTTINIFARGCDNDKYSDITVVTDGIYISEYCKNSNTLHFNADILDIDGVKEIIKY